MLLKWIIAIIVGTLLICIVALLMLASGLFVYDEVTPGATELSTSGRTFTPQEVGKKIESSIYTAPELMQQLSRAMPGTQYEKQCQDRSALVRRFYDLGAEDVWVQRESQPLQLYIQLPNDATVRQAIIDRVAAECACGEVASHHHFLVGEDYVVVGLIRSD